MHLGKFFHTKSGKYLMSLILGFGLATLFRTVCQGKNCIALKAPQVDDIKGKIYRHGNKCFQYAVVPGTCNAKMEQVPMET